MTLPIKVEAQIRAKVKEGRAPECANCGEGGTLAGVIGKGTLITCSSCGVHFDSLKEAWQHAYRMAAKRRQASEAFIK